MTNVINIIERLFSKPEELKSLIPEVKHHKIGNIVIDNLDFISELTKLTTLNLTMCEDLENIDGLLNCKNIRLKLLFWVLIFN